MARRVMTAQNRSTLFVLFPYLPYHTSSMSTMPLPAYLSTSPSPVPPPTTVRLQALYASTSAQRQSNPTGYSANVSWWSGLVEELLRAGYLGDDHLVIKFDEGLLGALEWNGGRPKGFGGVVVSTQSFFAPSPDFDSYSRQTSIVMGY